MDLPGLFYDYAPTISRCFSSVLRRAPVPISRVNSVLVSRSTCPRYIMNKSQSIYIYAHCGKKTAPVLRRRKNIGAKEILQRNSYMD